MRLLVAFHLKAEDRKWNDRASRHVPKHLFPSLGPQCLTVPQLSAEVPPAGDQVFRIMSLSGTFCIQITAVV